MSTLKVNKIRDTAGSADAITLDPNGGAVIAGVTTVSTVKVGSGVTITSDGDIFHAGVCTATSFSGQIPAASIVGVCTSGLTKTGGFGKLLKYETYTTTTATSTSGQTFVDTGLSGTIQPSAASSKILVIVNQFFRTTSSTVNTGTSVQVLEGSNVIVPSQTWDLYYFGGGGASSTSMNFHDRFAVTMIHTPSYSVGDTLTYKTQMKSLSDGGTTASTAQHSSSSSYITLIEVSG